MLRPMSPRRGRVSALSAPTCGGCTILTRRDDALVPVSPGRTRPLRGTPLACSLGIMFVDFAAQTAPALWALIAAMVILGLLIFASVAPELAEVYLGDMQILVATVALAALAIVLLVPGRVDMVHRFGPLSAASQIAVRPR